MVSRPHHRSRSLSRLHRSPHWERPSEFDPTEAASTRMLSLWIDLLRQAGGDPTAIATQPRGELGRQHLNALDFLRHGPRSSRSLAAGIGVGPAAASAATELLVELGLVELSRDGAVVPQGTLSITAAGAPLVAHDRRVQSAALRHLLSQLDPARLLVMQRAMAQLARALQPFPPVSTSGRSAPAPQAR